MKHVFLLMFNLLLGSLFRTYGCLIVAIIDWTLLSQCGMMATNGKTNAAVLHILACMCRARGLKGCSPVCQPIVLLLQDVNNLEDGIHIHIYCNRVTLGRLSWALILR